MAGQDAMGELRAGIIVKIKAATSSDAREPLAYVNEFVALAEAFAKKQENERINELESIAQTYAVLVANIYDSSQEASLFKESHQLVDAYFHKYGVRLD